MQEIMAGKQDVLQWLIFAVIGLLLFLTTFAWGSKLSRNQSGIGFLSGFAIMMTGMVVSLIKAL